jgi:hypothetical protein
MLRTTCDTATDWLMISGEFVAGRVYQPANGPRHEAHWMLVTSGPMQMPGSSAGWGESIDAAREQLLASWQAWLKWAELRRK